MRERGCQMRHFRAIAQDLAALQRLSRPLLCLLDALPTLFPSAVSASAFFLPFFLSRAREPLYKVASSLSLSSSVGVFCLVRPARNRNEPAFPLRNLLSRISIRDFPDWHNCFCTKDFVVHETCPLLREDKTRGLHKFAMGCFGRRSSQTCFCSRSVSAKGNPP